MNRRLAVWGAVCCAALVGCGGGRGAPRETVPLPRGLDPNVVTLNGPWADGEGHVVRLFHDASGLLVVDPERRLQFRGEVRGRRLVLRGREGVIGEDARRLRWDDGSVWTRTLAGTWIAPGRRRHEMKHLGKDVLAVDLEDATQHRGTVQDRVVLLDGKKGAVSQDYMRIDWGDGQSWERQ